MVGPMANVASRPLAPEMLLGVGHSFTLQLVCRTFASACVGCTFAPQLVCEGFRRVFTFGEMTLIGEGGPTNASPHVRTIPSISGQTSQETILRQKMLHMYAISISLNLPILFCSLTSKSNIPTPDFDLEITKICLGEIIFSFAKDNCLSMFV